MKLMILPLMGLSALAHADTPVPNAWTGTVTTVLRSAINTTDENGGTSSTTSEVRMIVQIPPSGPAQVQVTGKETQDVYGMSAITEYCGANPGDGKGTVITKEHASGTGQASTTADGKGYQPSVIFAHDGTYQVGMQGGLQTTVPVVGAYQFHTHHGCANKGDDNVSNPINEPVGFSGYGTTGSSTYQANPDGTPPKSVSGSYVDSHMAPQYIGSIQWSLSRGPADVKAKTTQPTYTVDRGGLVILDGSPSTGPITKYKWLLDPGADCGSNAPPHTEMKGKQIAFFALCGISATLQVSDDSGSDQTSATVTVNARKGWATTVSQDDGFTPLVSAWSKAAGFNGQNRCALDAADSNQASDHWIHHSDPNSWAGDGFQIAQVRDPGAPFDGFWWIASQKLQIHRKALINSTFLPGGDVALLNGAAPGNPTDLATLVLQIQSHESLHTLLVQQQFMSEGSSYDPANNIEGIFGTDQTATTKAADAEIREVESELGTTNWDAKIAVLQATQFGHSGTIRVPPNDDWNIPSFSELGNED